MQNVSIKDFLLMLFAYFFHDIIKQISALVTSKVYVDDDSSLYSNRQNVATHLDKVMKTIYDTGI